MSASHDRIIPRIDRTGAILLGLAKAALLAAYVLMASKAHAQSSPAVEFALPANPGEIAIMLDNNVRAAAVSASEALKGGDTANFCLNAAAAFDFEEALGAIALYSLTFTERANTYPVYVVELQKTYAEKCRH